MADRISERIPGRSVDHFPWQTRSARPVVVVPDDPHDGDSPHHGRGGPGGAANRQAGPPGAAPAIASQPFRRLSWPARTAAQVLFADSIDSARDELDYCTYQLLKPASGANGMAALRPVLREVDRRIIGYVNKIHEPRFFRTAVTLRALANDDTLTDGQRRIHLAKLADDYKHVRLDLAGFRFDRIGQVFSALAGATKLRSLMLDAAIADPPASLLAAFESLVALAGAKRHFPLKMALKFSAVNMDPDGSSFDTHKQLGEHLAFLLEGLAAVPPERLSLCSCALQLPLAHPNAFLRPLTRFLGATASLEAVHLDLVNTELDDPEHDPGIIDLDAAGSDEERSQASLADLSDRRAGRVTDELARSLQARRRPLRLTLSSNVMIAPRLLKLAARIDMAILARPFAGSRSPAPVHIVFRRKAVAGGGACLEIGASRRPGLGQLGEKERRRFWQNVFAVLAGDDGFTDLVFDGVSLDLDLATSLLRAICNHARLQRVSLRGTTMPADAYARLREFAISRPGYARSLQVDDGRL